MRTNYQETVKFSLSLLKMLEIQTKKRVQLSLMCPKGDFEAFLKVCVILVTHYLCGINRNNPMFPYCMDESLAEASERLDRDVMEFCRASKTPTNS